ncbi:MAG TPA: AmmeMemoRadiSam system protein B [Chromatiales bacterium]|nr:AmmeMemoRadiSam system protein B [Chromatiales bacterium]
MATVRPPAVAGMFYPDDPETLRREVIRFLETAKHPTITPKAVVAPHAGYIYSGPVAASVYSALTNEADRIHRVVMFGPAHRLAFRGIAYSDADFFRTPLGDVSVDKKALDEAASLPHVHHFEAPFEGEHCLEVQLPFLQMTLIDFSIVPFLVGDATADEVAGIIERLWGGDETLFVISSDLSHYLDYESARAIDSRTTQAIEALQPEAIAYDQACGRTPLTGLLKAAKQHGLKAKTLDLRNSGDTAGPRNQVVGYGAYAFY